MLRDKCDTEACSFDVNFNGKLFKYLTVDSFRMELIFEPNSSALSCARVRKEKKQTENAEKQ